ncbi:MAG: hypothetical protein MR745_01400 [Clostridiales bacterium]|nr:hypothetical protein [Eubacteriales bacterium]MCI6633038.1 hypothetical protein [Clostridiales bacterium]MDD5810295.1 hypothetical protein [Clostridiales bacterium]MDY4398099.1 hypothetical protein [Eubacteriales bacterium]MDY4469233.1 hypothetical protein [Eubacteriales bacterium]
MEDNRAKKLLDSFVDRLKADKRLEIAVYCGLGALCLLLCLPAYGGKKQKEEAKDTETVQQDDLEQRLMDTLSCVRGAGKVKVMITYETGKEKIPAMNTDITQSSTYNGEGENRTESLSPVTVYQNGENEAVVLMERQPTVRGVIVVAQGAADISVRMKLQSAVQAVLGVEASRVEVLEMGINGTEE